MSEVSPIALIDLDHGLCLDLAQDISRARPQIKVAEGLLKVLWDLRTSWQFYLTTHLSESELEARPSWRETLSQSGLKRYPITYLPYDESVSDHKFRLAEFLGARVCVEGSKATANVLAARGQAIGLRVALLPRGPLSEGVIVTSVVRLTQDEDLAQFLRHRS